VEVRGCWNRYAGHCVCKSVASGEVCVENMRGGDKKWHRRKGYMSIAGQWLGLRFAAAAHEPSRQLPFVSTFSPRHPRYPHHHRSTFYNLNP
jgi:hypothetical protein